MAYLKVRKTVSKKRYVFTIYNGSSIRRVRVRAHTLSDGKKQIKKKHPEWELLRIVQVD